MNWFERLFVRRTPVVEQVQPPVNPNAITQADFDKLAAMFDRAIKDATKRIYDLEQLTKYRDAEVAGLRDKVFQLHLYFRQLGYNPSPRELDAFGRRP